MFSQATVNTGRPYATLTCCWTTLS